MIWTCAPEERKASATPRPILLQCHSVSTMRRGEKVSRVPSAAADNDGLVAGELVLEVGSWSHGGVGVRALLWGTDK